jgi:hypothetical protein
MQIKKAGVVATGALATVAVMGAPAAAAPSMDATALTKASTLNLARGGSWDAPWDQDAQSLLAVGSGSALHIAAWQFCGASAGGAVVGVTLDLDSPNTVLGDCNNGNIKLSQDTNPAVISVLNDTAISVASWQACGSQVGGGVGVINATVQSPSTVVGNCSNGNIMIGREHEWEDDHGDDHGDHNGYHKSARGGYDYHEESSTVTSELVRQATDKVAKSKTDAAKDARTAWANRKADGKSKNVTPQTRNGWVAPWDQPAQSVASIGTGSAVTALTWQACGSESVFGVIGVVASATSPATVWGDCDNANVWIDQDDPTALISVLDNSRVSLLDWQNCGSSTVSGVIGVTASLSSQNTVFGNCNNANTVIS